MTENEMARRRTVAIEAARAAAAQCAAAATGTQSIRVKGRFDVVTETDGAVEREIAARLRSAFPDDRIVGEEGAEGQDTASLAEPGLCWLLDPICGTDNFAHGLPLYCTNIVLLRDGDPVLAVVAEGARAGEILCAERGAGTWAIDASGKRRPLRVSDASGIVVFDLGYLPSYGRIERPLRIAGELIRRNRFALRILSTSATLAQQARGAVAGNIIEEAKPWDLAGGALLLREAGAQVAGLDGTPWTIQSPCLISGSTPEVHAELLDCVATARAGLAANQA